MSRSLCLHFCEAVENTPGGSGSRHVVRLLIGDELCPVKIRVRTRGGRSIDRQDDQFMLWIIS